VALVTGGSRGIGKAIAHVLAEAGAKVAVVARNGAQAEDAAAAIGHGAIGLPCDVAKPADAERAVETVEERLGPLEILVNNAGITRDTLLARMDEEAWNSVLDTNLKGAFLMMKHATRGMMKRRHGRVINITSVVGIGGNKGQANYAASKAGLIGLTKAVSKELASRNVLINAVAPGFVETDLTRNVSEEARKMMLDRISLGRLGLEREIAGAVLFLASDLASYITGQVLVVDGGMAL
jgi:3-oxoacyl-[acyl-carrier protein] reductase